MKKALVLALVCAFGLGAGAFAGPITGFWNTNIILNIDTIGIHSFVSVLDIDYTVSGWTFGMTSVFLGSGLANVFFQASGQLGAFSGGTFLDFSPATKLFEQWLTGVKVNIAGVALYGFFDLQACATVPGNTQTDAGTGWLLGLEGGAGDFTMRAEAIFNLGATLIAQSATYDDIVGHFAEYAYPYDPLHMSTGNCDNSAMVAADYFWLAACTDCFCFDGITFRLGFPFACIDSVLFDIAFIDTGFSYFKLRLDDIYLSTDWLYIDDFDITWKTQTKSVAVDLKLKISQACLTPYFGIIPVTDATSGYSSFTINGIELYALGLTYSFNGVTFKSVTLLNTTDYKLTWAGKPMRHDDYIYCHSNYDELIEVIVDSDACCGGAFSFDVKNWFDVDGPTVGIFGWMETSVDFSIGIGSNFALTMMLQIDTVAAKHWGMGFNVSW